MIPLFVKFWDLPQSWGGTTWQLSGEGGDGEGDRRDLGALEVTPENIAVNLRVTRGPDWTWSDEDGGEGKTGVILSFDKSKAIAQVLWEGGQAHKHYRFGLKSDLMICIGANSSLGRRNSQLFFCKQEPNTFDLWLGWYSFPDYVCALTWLVRSFWCFFMFSSRNFGPFLYLQRNSQELVKDQAWNLVRFGYHRQACKYVLEWLPRSSK